MANTKRENSLWKGLKKHKYIIFVFFVILISVAHIMGYKIFGKETVIKNQPLKSPQKLKSITKLTEVVLDSGKNYKIYGIEMIAPIPSTYQDILSPGFNLIKRQMRIQGINLEVEIETPESEVSKIWYKECITYYGNDVITWHSIITDRLFPPRRPLFRKSDLAKLLVEDGLAIPKVELFEKDKEYARELILSFGERNLKNINVEENKDKAIMLGKYICDNYQDLFNKGAWLLAHCGDTEITDPVEKNINELLSKYDEEVKTKGSFYSNPGFTISVGQKLFELADILIKVSPEESKPYFHNILSSRRSAYLRVPIAAKLLGIGDISGLDMLMEELNNNKPKKGYRTDLSSELEDMLNNRITGIHFTSNNDKEMYEWYQKNRLNLKWDEDRYKIILTNPIQK